MDLLKAGSGDTEHPHALRTIAQCRYTDVRFWKTSSSSLEPIKKSKVCFHSTPHTHAKPRMFIRLCAAGRMGEADATKTTADPRNHTFCHSQTRRQGVCYPPVTSAPLVEPQSSRTGVAQSPVRGLFDLEDGPGRGAVRSGRGRAWGGRTGARGVERRKGRRGERGSSFHWGCGSEQSWSKELR